VNDLLYNCYNTNYTKDHIKKNEAEFEKIKNNLIKYKTNHKFNEISGNKNIKKNISRQNSSNISINNLSNYINVSKNDNIVKEDKTKISNYNNRLYESNSHKKNQINCRNNNILSRKQSINKNSCIKKGIHIKGFEKLVNRKNNINRNSIIPISVTERMKYTNTYSSITSSNRNNNISNCVNVNYNNIIRKSNI
jgi:hypothetical protein